MGLLALKFYCLCIIRFNVLKQVNIGGNAYTAARGAQALGVSACVLHLTSMHGIYKQLRASKGVFHADSLALEKRRREHWGATRPTSTNYLCQGSPWVLTRSNRPNNLVLTASRLHWPVSQRNNSKLPWQKWQTPTQLSSSTSLSRLRQPRTDAAPPPRRTDLEQATQAETTMLQWNG